MNWNDLPTVLKIKLIFLFSAKWVLITFNTPPLTLALASPTANRGGMVWKESVLSFTHNSHYRSYSWSSYSSM